MKKSLTFFLLSLLLFSFFIPLIDLPAAQAAGENWLEDWTYRKSHVINSATGAGTNYQIKIYVWNATGIDSGNNVTLDGNVLSDNFGDVRFTDDDGSTLLDYWIESINSTTAIFWVEIADSLESSAQAIYIYYGKADTTTLSNGENTFDFFDDFNDNSFNTTKWTTESGSAVESGGYLAVQGDILHSAINITYLGARFRTQTKIVTTTSLSAFGLDNLAVEYIRFQRSIAMYTITCDPSETTTNIGDKAGAWNIFSFNWNLTEGTGRGVQFFVNDASVSYHSANIPDSFMYVRLISITGNPEVDVNWIFISKYVFPEPTHGAWGSEEEYEVEEDTYYLDYSDISQNSTMLNSNVLFSALWNGNDTLSSWSFGWNYSGSFVYDGAEAFSNSTPPQWSNATKELEGNIAYYGYVIQWSFNVTGINGATNTTGLQAFTLSAISMDFAVYGNGTFYVSAVETENETSLMFPDYAYNCSAAPDPDWEFEKFTINGTDSTYNPTDFSLNITTYMADNFQNMQCYFVYSPAPTPTPTAPPSGGATKGEFLAAAIVAILIFGIGGLLVLVVLLRRR